MFKLAYSTLSALFILCIAGCAHSEQPASASSVGGAVPASTLAGITATEQVFDVVSDGSHTEFYMTAPIENIHGLAPNSLHGSVAVDSQDFYSVRGVIRLDLDTLEIFQAFRNDAGEFENERKNELQNEHMKNWFQISDDAPPSIREQNRWALLTIQRITPIDLPADFSVPTDGSVSFKADVSADLFLHNISLPQTTQVNVEVDYAAGSITEMRVHSSEPLSVNLAAYELQPRSAFSVLAEKSLGALGKKVAEEAPVELRFKVVPKR